MPEAEIFNQSDPHVQFFNSVEKEVLFYGGKGSGKSFSATDKILLLPAWIKSELEQDVKLKSIVIRKTLPSLKRTCIELFDKRSDLHKIPYKLNKSDFIANYYNGSSVMFISLDDSEAHKKLHSLTDVDVAWFEEVNEISERDYEDAILTLRGGFQQFKQAICTFNPIGITSWVYDRFFIRNANNPQKIHSTVEHNEFIDPDYIKTLKSLKESNINLFKVYYLGEWGRLEGIIYDNFKIVPAIPDKVDEIIYGQDFGFNNPSALVEVSICDKAYYCRQIIYETHLTNNDLISRYAEAGVIKGAPIYCDSAEPNRIEEIRRAGYNPKPADKDVKAGIDYVKAQDLNFLESSTDLIAEANSYVWEIDKNGKPLDRPVKFADHILDSVRYSIFTHSKKPEARARYL